MEAPPCMNKLKKQEFTLASVTDLTTSSSSLSSSPVVATFSCVDEVTELRFQESESSDGFSFDLTSSQVGGCLFAFNLSSSSSSSFFFFLLEMMI